MLAKAFFPGSVVTRRQRSRGVRTEYKKKKNPFSVPAKAFIRVTDTSSVYTPFAVGSRAATKAVVGNAKFILEP